METSDHLDDEDNIKSLGIGSAELVTDKVYDSIQFRWIETQYKYFYQGKIVGEGGPSTWQASESSDDETEDLKLIEEVKPKKTVLDDIGKFNFQIVSFQQYYSLRRLFFFFCI